MIPYKKELDKTMNPVFPDLPLDKKTALLNHTGEKLIKTDKTIDMISVIGESWMNFSVMANQKLISSDEVYQMITKGERFGLWLVADELIRLDTHWENNTWSVTQRLVFDLNYVLSGDVMPMTYSEAPFRLFDPLDCMKAISRFLSYHRKGMKEVEAVGLRAKEVLNYKEIIQAGAENKNLYFWDGLDENDRRAILGMDLPLIPKEEEELIPF